MGVGAGGCAPEDQPALLPNRCLGQTTLYEYFVDDNLKQVSYTNSVVSTPGVSFAYEAHYNRLIEMIGAIGKVGAVGAIGVSRGLGGNKVSDSHNNSLTIFGY